MRKKIALIISTAMIVAALTGCTVTKTETHTETHTDENGNTTTTSTTVTNTNGETTTETSTETTDASGAVVEKTSEETASSEIVTATLVITNSCGVDIYEFYFAPSSSSDWGTDLADGEPFLDGEIITFENGFKYKADDLKWDFRAVDINGGSVDFAEIDLANANDPLNIQLTLTHNEEDGDYEITIE